MSLTAVSHQRGILPHFRIKYRANNLCFGEIPPSTSISSLSPMHSWAVDSRQSKPWGEGVGDSKPRTESSNGPTFAEHTIPTRRRDAGPNHIIGRAEPPSSGQWHHNQRVNHGNQSCKRSVKGNNYLHIHILRALARSTRIT